MARRCIERGSRAIHLRVGTNKYADFAGDDTFAGACAQPQGHRSLFRRLGGKRKYFWEWPLKVEVVPRRRSAMPSTSMSSGASRRSAFVRFGGTCGS